MKSIHRLTVLLILGVLLLGAGSVGEAQTSPERTCRYFPKTGHYVCDKFLDFFETRGALEIFGYPLTVDFVDRAHGGLRVQYFQRARMEEHPYNAPPYDVQLGLLVDELDYKYPGVRPEATPAPDDPAHLYFPETEHVVSYAFLDFFRENGGLDIFGFPRSEMVYEDGVVVQYFQRARMVWHREKPPGQQIVLSKIGERYVERSDIPQMYVRRRPPPPRIETPRMALGPQPHRTFLPLVAADFKPGELAPRTTEPTTAKPTTEPSGAVTELDVSASVRYPISGRTGTQTVFIYVHDQQGHPVGGAEARLVIHYESGDDVCVAQPSDAAGSTRCSFEILSPPVGKQVVIDIIVTYDRLTASTQTFFMPWW